MLLLGWSILEGVGAALILPANRRPRRRKLRRRPPAGRPMAWSRPRPERESERRSSPTL
jgi:hypothetical protein